MIRHYRDLLDDKEASKFRLLLLKASYSLLGLLMITPYVAYNLLTFKRDPAMKKPRLLNGLIVQMVFTFVNWRWSKQFFNFDDQMEKKYLSHLPDSALRDFSTGYMPWYISQKRAILPPS